MFPILLGHLIGFGQSGLHIAYRHFARTISRESHPGLFTGGWRPELPIA
jgi:hypothetical protein